MNQTRQSADEGAGAMSEGIISVARSTGLGEAIHPPPDNHTQIYEGLRYSLKQTVNEITYGGAKPLPPHEGANRM